MTCAACETTSPINFWRCPECQELNSSRVVKWWGAILSPLVCLLLACFGDQFGEFFGIPQRFLNLGGMIFYFPLAGVPFVWRGEEGWKDKIGYSMVYVVGCYGAAVLMMIILIIIFLGLPGRFSL